MHIDCESCPARGYECDDCVVSVLLGPPDLTGAELAAIDLLADRGMVMPLRGHGSVAG